MSKCIVCSLPALKTMSVCAWHSSHPSNTSQPTQSPHQPADSEQIDKILDNYRNASDEFHDIDISDHAIAKQAIQALISKREREAEDKLVDFAKDVIGSYGYEIADGIYTSGGFSTQELAFSILRRNGLLNKKGQYDTNPPTIKHTKGDTK